MEQIEDKIWNLGRQSNFTTYSKEIFDIIWSMDNVSDIQILLTIIASYYVNGEVIKENSVVPFIIKSCDYFIKSWKIDLSKKEWNNTNLEKIKAHFEVYKQVEKMWQDFEKWEKSIKDIVAYIWENLHDTKFREDIVVHWFSARKKRKKFSEYTKDDYINSNFIFPPHTYINELLSKLEERLKDKNLWVYDKAALIWSYIFLIHPFEDGNSRTSRIMMISYLDEKSKKHIKLYTFLSNLVANIDTYFDFLKKELYDKFYKDVIEKLELKWEWDNIEISEYMDIDDYEKIILEFSKKIKLRLIDISKNIIENIKYINYLMLVLIHISEIKEENEKKIAIYFLWKMLDEIKEIWFEWIFDDNIFSVSKSFLKKFKNVPDIDKKIENVKKEFQLFKK